MIVEVNMKSIEQEQLTVPQYFVLYFLYHKKYDECAKFIGKELSKAVRNELVGSKFIISDKTVKFTETMLSISNVRNLIGLGKEDINFWEWYQIYPIRVGTRVLRSSKDGTATVKKHRDKYLKRVKTVEQHRKAIASTEAYIAVMKQANKLSFLLNIETVLNNSKWEDWEEYLTTPADSSVNFYKSI